jgi:molybdenum cofactor biosynthesis protein A
MLTDNHGRPVSYLRLAVTDRCNLRCQYCMPSGGLDWVPKNDLLSYEEILLLLRVFAGLGITKLRLTGGEPFLRKDLMELIREIQKQQLFTSVSITTNGTLTGPHIPELKQLGIHSVNLSLDTFDRRRFEMMTRRQNFDVVSDTLFDLLKWEIPTRINAVIMEGKNEEDIAALSALTLTRPLSVRFIEEMPFNGSGDRHAIRWNWTAILEELKHLYPAIEKLRDEPGSTSMNYQIPGAPGTIGIIAAYTRSFCGSCNRIRLTPKGTLKTCLYDQGVLDLRSLIRSGESESKIKSGILHAISQRAKDGFEAEKMRGKNAVGESMATIGG